MSTKNPIWVAPYYRFRNDDGSLSAATWLNDENIANTTLTQGDTFRLRYTVAETNAANTANSRGWKLQFRVDTGGGFGSWTDVGSATAIKYTTSAYISDGGNETTQRLSSVGGSTWTGSYMEADTNNATTTQTWSDNHAEMEFVLNVNSASSGDVFEFRAVTSSNETATYTNVPSITVPDLSITRSPAAANLTLSTTAPTATVSAVSRAQVSWARFEIPVSTATPGQVSPTSAQLSFSTTAPTAVTTEHHWRTPASAQLALDGSTPSAFASDVHEAQPAAAQLTLSSTAPTVATSANWLLSPSAGQITLTSTAPTAVTTEHHWRTPASAQLTLSTTAPNVGAGESWSVSPGAAQLTLSASAPSAVTTAHWTASPAAAQLVASTTAPVATLSENWRASPAAAQLTLSSTAPTAERSASGVSFQPAAAQLTLSTTRPAAVNSGDALVERANAPRFICNVGQLWSR